MHFCRVTHVLYLCHNTYFWGAWMIKSFFFSFLFFQVTWQKLVMSWGPLKSSGTNQGWWVWNEISVVLGVFHNWYWTELFSKVDYFNNCWRTVWTLRSVKRFIWSVSLPPQISALVTMYSHEEDIDSAIDIFKQAIEHFQSEQVCVYLVLVSRTSTSSHV